MQIQLSEQRPASSQSKIQLHDGTMKVKVILHNHQIETNSIPCAVTVLQSEVSSYNYKEIVCDFKKVNSVHNLIKKDGLTLKCTQLYGDRFVKNTKTNKRDGLRLRTGCELRWGPMKA